MFDSRAAAAEKRTRLVVRGRKIPVPRCRRRSSLWRLSIRIRSVARCSPTVRAPPTAFQRSHPQRGDGGKGAIIVAYDDHCGLHVSHDDLCPRTNPFPPQENSVCSGLPEKLVPLRLDVEESVPLAQDFSLHRPVAMTLAALKCICTDQRWAAYICGPFGLIQRSSS